jgi:hypothetical protein
MPRVVGDLAGCWEKLVFAQTMALTSCVQTRLDSVSQFFTNHDRLGRPKILETPTLSGSAGLNLMFEIGLFVNYS